ncbi:heparinase II/III family protein [Sphingomonas donggukensis]|uniref:Heparinase II/III family protein n=1 Tax=Sphingomonas donggukensis TaxID=2949093 RepID=A0ABY4TQG0_9SPHN|nr:heparinase II/III family protein [Sphingomonas donggukensis]URW74452.1 heparinase II/III family protein [Sphingomonas donggukensis]
MSARRLIRAAQFARYVPVSQLLWRVRLAGQRRLGIGLRTSGKPAPPLAPEPPQPVFPPRTGLIERGEGGWRCTFVGRSVDVGDPVDWSLPSRGAADQLWRMNLHYFEYLEALDRDAGLDLIRQWIATHPSATRETLADAWNSYALSLRVVCWMQFLARTGGAGDVRDVVDALARQMRFLTRNLERDLGGNHLMKNIKALLWASAVFSGAEAGEWRALGTRLLRRELATQVLGDGVHYELSPSYHAQVLADLIEIRHAAGEVLPGLGATIAAMTRAAVDLAHPDGRAALFNDAGLHMAYPPAAFAEAAPQPVFAYREAGYYGAHLPAWSIIADMGRIGADSLPAHAHGDIGTFELSVAGLRFVVDQGVFEYVAGPRRSLSRAAHAHAALAIAGAEQADFFGAFRCGRRPDVTVTQWQPGEAGFVLEGTHDGYSHLSGAPVATRRFEVSADAIRITDRLSARVDAAVSVGLLLHPECVVTISDGIALVRRGDAAIAVQGSGTLSDAPATWWPDMGVEHATRRLTLTWAEGSDEGWLQIRPLAG